MRSVVVGKLLLFSLVLIGCGPTEPVPVPVHGKVTFDGKPLAEGQVAFITPGQVPELIDVHDGTFDGKAKWGSRRVEIAAYRPYRIPADTPKHLIPLMKDGKENYLPDKYHTKSTLTAEIHADSPNELNFELRSK